MSEGWNQEGSGGRRPAAPEEAEGWPGAQAGVTGGDQGPGASPGGFRPSLCKSGARGSLRLGTAVEILHPDVGCWRGSTGRGVQAKPDCLLLAKFFGIFAFGCDRALLNVLVLAMFTKRAPLESLKDKLNMPQNNFRSQSCHWLPAV